MLSCLSIDDNEQENLKKCCDEVFGARNFIAQIAWEKVHTRKYSAINFSSSHEYILCYAKVRRNYSGDTVGFKRNLLPRDNGHLYAHHRRYAAWRAEKIGGFMESVTAANTPEPPDPPEQGQCKVIPFEKVG